MAYARAAETEREAANLRKEAEDEHSARVKIEARVAWRRLTESQIVEIGSNLHHFPRLNVAVGYDGTDAESSSFSSDIADALDASHALNVTSMEGFLHTRTPTVRKGHTLPSVDTGVLVTTSRDDNCRLLGVAISRELIIRGFDTTVGPPATDKPNLCVQVDVGPHPVGPQGEYKSKTEQEAKVNKTTTGPTSP